MQKKIPIILAFLILAAVAAYFIFGKDKEPKFRKDTEMYFIDRETKEKIITIDVEVADEQEERMTGLMYRKSLPENAGMLFIFGRMMPQGFWMKNTYISLDIMYVNDQGVIISIAENTEPLSLKQIPSGKPAQYVVEVNAGFCRRHEIEVGDRIGFDGQ